mmetsp:Transcript_1217/g.4622  ORF Transcript_1217/g.4622 Transcript_1217/m.4622 type:complete len:241 (+) Transcript_1217:1072-1794(+)
MRFSRFIPTGVGGMGGGPGGGTGDARYERSVPNDCPGPGNLPGVIPIPGPGEFSSSFAPDPPSVGHPTCGISRGGSAPGPSRSNRVRSKSASLSAHTTRAMASVPSRTADNTFGSDRRCTARATLSPALNGSSTPTQYRPGAQLHPATHLPAYVLATRPCLHSGSTDRKCVKNVTKSSARLAWFSAPHPRQRKLRVSTGSMSRRKSLCCRIFETGNLRMGSRLFARSFSCAKSASAAALF